MDLYVHTNLIRRRGVVFQKYQDSPKFWYVLTTTVYGILQLPSGIIHSGSDFFICLLVQMSSIKGSIQ